jgi:HEAT repeat protein
MPAVRRFLLSILCGLLPALSSAVPPSFDFSHETVDQLIQLLNSDDPKKRGSAASYLGDRFADPSSLRIDILPAPEALRPTRDAALPANILPALNRLLTSDTNLSVRLCVLGALWNLKFRTNTTPLLAHAMNDPNAYARLRAANYLIEIAQRYKEPLHENIIPILRDSLTDIDTEVQWQAALAAGQLGSKAVPLTNVIHKLQQSPNSKVCGYAKRAIADIESKKQ